MKALQVRPGGGGRPGFLPRRGPSSPLRRRPVGRERGVAAGRKETRGRGVGFGREQDGTAREPRGKSGGHRHPADPAGAARGRPRVRARHRHGEPGELRAGGRLRRLLLPGHQQRPPHQAQIQAPQNIHVFCAGKSSAIEKRYFHHTEEMLRGHPELIDRTLPSLDTRMAIAATAVPELVAAAATTAISEWGRPAIDVTHLVVSTYCGAHMPGADLRLASLLGLAPSVRRTMLYLNGCNSGVTVVRVAKDIAENNHGARVLVACAELTLILLRRGRQGHAHHAGPVRKPQRMEPKESRGWREPTP